jgi:hypothetical protein
LRPRNPLSQSPDIIEFERIRMCDIGSTIAKRVAHLSAQQPAQSSIIVIHSPAR